MGMKPRKPVGKMFYAARFYPDTAEDEYLIGLWQPSKPPDAHRDAWVALFELKHWALMGGPVPDKDKNVLIMVSARELKR